MWTNAGNLLVGESGSGGLRIENGGKVTDSYGYLGRNAGATGEATVTGAASSWTNTGDLEVGASGAGTLTVENGGSVSAGTLWAAPQDLVGNGTINATGLVADMDLVFDALDATRGAQQTLAFGTGGALNLKVDGSGGLGDRSSLGVGFNNAGTLSVGNGAKVTSLYGYLGFGFGTGSSGSATVTGTGSRWTNSDGLTVGNYGSGTLMIENGGTVSDSSGDIARHSGSTGTVTVTGAGSTWTTT